MALERDMDIKIKEIIKDNLPQTVANEIQCFIENSNKISEEYESLKVKYDSLLEEKKILEEKVNNHMKQQKHLNKLEDDLKKLTSENLHEKVELEKRKNNFDIEVMKEKMKKNEYYTDKLFALVDKVFGVPTVITTNQRNSTCPVPENGYMGSQTLNETKTETVEKI